MSVLYIMLPAALLIAIAGVIAFIRAANSGQYDDLETPAHRILDEDTSAAHLRSSTPAHRSNATVARVDSPVIQSKRPAAH